MCGEHFSKAPRPGPEGCSFAYVRSSDYRSELQNMLQTWLIAGLGKLDEQA